MEKTFNTMIEGRPEPIQQVALKLRELIFDTLNGIEENIYGGIKVQNALYSKEEPKNVVCGIQTNDDYCMLYLHKTDHDEVDASAFKLEGQGKHAKHVKFYEPDEVDRQEVAPVLQEIYAVT